MPRTNPLIEDVDPIIKALNELATFDRCSVKTANELIKEVEQLRIALNAMYDRKTGMNYIPQLDQTVEEVLRE